MGGGRGCAKSFEIDACMLTRRGQFPGTVGCIVMRNYDQVRKYHIEPMMRNWPELEKFLNKSDGQLKWTGTDGKRAQIDFSYAENLADVERRFRSANYFDIFVDQAEQFTEDELREMKKACRWPGTLGKCKMMLAFNMGGIGIQTLRKWFHTREYNERETAENFAFVHVFPWDNVEWSRVALAEDGFTEDDYYRWTDEQRMLYCASRSDYGRDLNSADDALRNRDWLGSWESFEGAYFGRVFERKSTMVTAQQVSRLIQPWDIRWLSMDWGKTHYCVTYWHARTLLAPEQVLRVLGWTVDKPIKAVITYRELVLNEMSSPDVGRKLVEATAGEEKQVRNFYLSPDAFGERDSDFTTAMNLGAVLRIVGLPEPEPADNDRKGGWSLMYDLLQDTKRHGYIDGEVWLISAECPNLLESLPILMRDPKNLDDIIKTDTGAARLEQDVADSARYGLKSMLRPRMIAPQSVRENELVQSITDLTQKNIALMKFRENEMRRTRVSRAPSWRS